MVKNLPAIQETQKIQVRSLGREVPLEEEMATHSNILAWNQKMLCQGTDSPITRSLSLIALRLGTGTSVLGRGIACSEAQAS